MAWTTPGTAVAGDVLTAAFWNQQVRDQMTELAPFFGAWTSYTPTISQGATNNIAKTVNYARYLKIGRFVIVSAFMTVTGTGTGNNAIFVSMPSGADFASTVSIVAGAGRVIDTNVADYQVMVLRGGSTSVNFVNATGNTAGGSVGANPNFALANTDTITFTVAYESAA